MFLTGGNLAPILHSPPFRLLHGAPPIGFASDHNVAAGGLIAIAGPLVCASVKH
jgi:hypothetical protein